jgi:hypothetical protein
MLDRMKDFWGWLPDCLMFAPYAGFATSDLQPPILMLVVEELEWRFHLGFSNDKIKLSF